MAAALVFLCLPSSASASAGGGVVPVASSLPLGWPFGLLPSKHPPSYLFNFLLYDF